MDIVNLALTKKYIQEAISNIPQTSTIRQLPTYAIINGTMNDLIHSLDENNTPFGMAYLGSANCSDLPAGILQAELKIETIQNSQGLMVYYFEITSTEIKPYLWTGTGYLGVFNGWQARPLDTIEDNENYFNSHKIEDVFQEIGRRLQALENSSNNI